MYKVKDQFTTRDGSWTPNGELYSITPEMAARYGADANSLGGATNIYVKLEGGPGGEVRFFTNGGLVEKHPPQSNGWAHTTMFNPGSGYNPNNNVGPWSVMADEAPSEIVSGIGLPFGWHISTFVVFQWDDDEENGETPGPVDPTDPAPENLWVTVTVGPHTYEGYIKRN
jgi:hypothetical protein